MASLTLWTWVWVNSGSWLWTGRPGVLQFMESQRVGHDWVTELNWNELDWTGLYSTGLNWTEETAVAAMLLCAQLLMSCPILRTMGLLPTRLLCPWDSPGKNTGVGCRALLQVIFLTQESNPYLWYLLHCKQILYPLSHLGSPMSSINGNYCLEFTIAEKKEEEKKKYQ